LAHCFSSWRTFLEALKGQIVAALKKSAELSRVLVVSISAFGTVREK
jgi:hypothetical protein